MSYIRLFFPESLTVNFESELNKSQSYYLKKVMRLKEGDYFSLFNKNGEWHAIIKDASKNLISFQIKKKIREANTSRELWLAFTPIKFNNLNLMVQKATELGITRLIPILSERTVVRKINLERLKKILVEASEQSNRLDIPQLDELIPFEKFMNNFENTNILFGDLNSNNTTIKFDKNTKDPICILIGPEGDFSEIERARILKLKRIQSFSLSKNILRTETAAISAISIVNYSINL